MIPVSAARARDFLELVVTAFMEKGKTSAK